MPWPNNRASGVTGRSAGNAIVQADRAEIKKLRAKLQEVRDNCPPDTHGHNGEYFNVIREIVDEALKQIGPSNDPS